MYSIPPPTPNFPPSSGHAAIHWVGYDYWTPGQDPTTHKLITGVEFHVFVSATGKRFSIRYGRPSLVV